MPENETLIHDGRTVSRWRPLADRMDGGMEPIEAFPEIQDQFYASLRNVWRQWRDHGIDANDLFTAALNNPSKLRELIRQAKFDRNAQLLRDVALCLQNADMKSLIGAFLDAAWESVHCQLQLDCREDTLAPEFMSHIRGMLDRICQRLLRNLSRFSCRIRRKPPPDIGTRLGENLL